MRGVDGEFRPPTLKGMAVVYIKDMNIYCEVCDCHIKKSNWGKHLQTTKHGIACGEIVVEEVEKKQCWKCRGHKGLEMFRGENATCNGCLAHKEKWAGNNVEKVRELWQKYHAEHREEINEKKKVYNQLEVDCAVCGCRVLLGTNSWEFHERVWKRLHWELRIFHRCKFKGYTCTSAAEKELLAEIQKPADEIRSSFTDQIRGRAGHYLSFKVNRLKEFLQLLMQNSTRYSEWENDITCILLDINSMKSNCY